MTVDTLAKAGGLFAVFMFIHFAVDFVFQSHREAMAKHRDRWIRARHCAIYAAGFTPLFVLLWWDTAPWKITVSWNVLFWSHFIEDTYIPVLLWVKHVRKPPEMKLATEEGTDEYGNFVISKLDDAGRFRKFVSTPLGAILMVAVDQIVHLTFLWVPVILALWK